MKRRTWLVLAVALFAVLTIAGTAAWASIPAGTSASSPASVAAQSKDSEKAQPFDCSQVDKLNLEKQTNLHAYQLLVQCGRAPQAAPAKAGDAASGIVNRLLSPFAYGGVDVDVILPDSTYPKVTQSENMVWGHGTTVVSNYNDSRSSSGCYAGISYSTDNGVTFTRNNGGGASPLCTGHGTNYGDPIVVWNNHLNMWFAGDLATGCGGQGIGMWTSPDGVTWTTGACAHSGSSDDRESLWVDNNPASPYYGRMYVSWNNFAIGGGALYVTHSDDGTTWTPVQLNAAFIRDIQITGDLQGSGRVYVAAMNEGAGGLSARQNVMYRSTDGGATWASSNVGSSVQGPGRSTSGYFALVYSTIWRHMGWGQPAASGNVVHLNWAQCGQNVVCSGATDHGDIYYSRSTDAGVTWSTPIKMNSDSGTAMQWQPSMAATEGGAVYMGWYDQREANAGNDLNCTVGSPTQPCYRRYGKVSLDNGATWQTDDMTGDAMSHLPAQPDSAVQTTYEGDYDYISSNGTWVYDTWTDGRVLINNTSQQDVFLDRIPLVQGTPTPTVTGTPPTNTPTRTPTITPTFSPTPCGANSNYVMATATATVITGGTDIGNHTDDGVTDITLPFAFRLYDQVYTTVGLDSNGRAIFPTGSSAYSNVCLPSTGDTYTIYPYWDDLYTTNSGYGISTQVLGSAPNRLFVIYWHAQHFPGSGTVDFNLILHEAANPVADPSVFDVIFGSDTSPGSETIGVQKDDSLYTQYLCDSPATNNTKITFSQLGCGTVGPTNTPQPTNTPGGPSPTQTPTPGCTPQAAGWVSGPVHPANPGIIRAVGVYFPANGKFYTIGGRTSDSAGSDTTNPYEYNPATNTWATKAYTYPDTEVNNMACAVLTVSSTPYIYCVGGSAAGATTATARVFRYNPATDTGNVVTGDEWPGNSTGDKLPGGFAVYNNKLYVIGGFQINIGMIAQVWEYDPNAAGSHWTAKADMPYPLGYVPAATIGNYIYTAGGSDWDGTTLIDSASTYRYDPATNTWDDAAIADLPQYTAETRALNYQGKLWVMGGGRTAPNPSNVVQAWDPATNTWSTPTSFVEARRNFPVDTDGMYIWLAGGYAPSSATNTMEIYRPAIPCETPTVGPTSTSEPATSTATTEPGTPTNTATPPVGGTPTPCTISFTDVPVGSTFYTYIRCLACRGIVSGYADHTFRPNNPITRGQIAKVVANAAGYNDAIPSNRQSFEDVPSSNPFWVYIERVWLHGVMTGYQCGGVGEPCIPGPPPTGRPYFRPWNNTTRGQMAKVDSEAAGYNDPIPTNRQTYTDVPYTNTFWEWIERLTERGIVGGYADHTFRPFNEVTRGQASKIVANTFFPNCVTPSRPNN